MNPFLSSKRSSPFKGLFPTQPRSVCTSNNSFLKTKLEETKAPSRELKISASPSATKNSVEGLLGFGNDEVLLVSRSPLFQPSERLKGSDRLTFDKIEQEIERKLKHSQSNPYTFGEYLRDLRKAEADKVKPREEVDQEYLESLPIGWERSLLEANYRMADKINQAFSLLPEDLDSIESSDFQSELLNSKARLTGYKIQLKEYERELTRIMKEHTCNLSDVLKTKKYWTAVSNPDLPDAEIRNKIGDNDLFSRRCESVFTRAEKVFHSYNSLARGLGPLTENSRSLPRCSVVTTVAPKVSSTVMDRIARM